MNSQYKTSTQLLFSDMKRWFSRTSLARRARIAAVVAVVLLLVGFGVHRFWIKEKVYQGCLVTEKDRAKGGRSSDMRIYTANCGTFQVKDNHLKRIWNSSDIYSSIQVGEHYDLTATGVRSGFMSMFPSIVKADLLNEKDK